MAIVTRAEFASICNRTVAIINTNVSRKKISTLPDKTIDTENPLNKIFFKKCKKEDADKLEEQRAEKRQAKSAPESSAAPISEPAVRKLYEEVVEKVEPKVERFTKVETPAEKKAREKQNEEDAELVDWKKRKEKADALKAERQAELAQLQVEKLMGSLMPVDLAEMMLKINIQDIFRTFEIELHNMASIYCDILAGGDRKKLAEIVSKLRLKLNEVIKRVEETAAQEIENAIEEYAEVRSRGERK